MRNVVVTGATRGIGRAITQTLLQAGYHVLAVARSPSHPVKGATPDNYDFVPGDLSDSKSFSDLADRLLRWGPIYGLVNNAGIGTPGVLTLMPVREITRLIEINLLGSILLTRQIVGPMLVQRQGRIINVTSIVAQTGFSGLSVYSATKAGLEGFTRSLARELGPIGITVNAVAPGFVDTEMTHGLNEKDRGRISNRSALKRMATAEDIAATVAFLMGDAAANITGTVLTVDAGNTA